MLLLSSVDTIVILEGGLWPPYFLMSPPVVALSCLCMLLLPPVDSLVILEGGLWPFFVVKMGLLVGHCLVFAQASLELLIKLNYKGVCIDQSFDNDPTTFKSCVSGLLENEFFDSVTMNQRLVA